MRRILIIAPNWIGDAVMSQPLLAKLKALHPNSQIDVLATTWVAPIYRTCTEVHQVIEAKLEHQKLQWGLRKALAKELHSKQYQMCFVLPNSLKSSLIPWLANIPLRIGYQGEMRFGLINISLPNPSKVNRPPMVEHYLALASLINEDSDSLATPQTSSSNPVLHIAEQAKQSVDAKLKASQIDPQHLFVFCPGAEYGVTKRWPTNHFAQLAQLLNTENSQNQIILLGSKSDHALAQEIEQLASKQCNIHNWCGNTSLDEAIALIGVSQTIVSNDSGLMHIAAALKTPQVAIFGSSDPQHTPPLSKQAKVIWLSLPCSPCHKRQCPLGHLKCLKDISPDQVLSTIKLFATS